MTKEIISKSKSTIYDTRKRFKIDNRISNEVERFTVWGMKKILFLTVTTLTNIDNI